MTLAVVLIFSCRPELEADEFSALEDGCVGAAAVDMDGDEERASEGRGSGIGVVVVGGGGAIWSDLRGGRTSWSRVRGGQEAQCDGGRWDDELEWCPREAGRRREQSLGGCAKSRQKVESEVQRQVIGLMKQPKRGAEAKPASGSSRVAVESALASQNARWVRDAARSRCGAGGRQRRVVCVRVCVCSLVVCCSTWSMVVELHGRLAAGGASTVGQPVARREGAFLLDAAFALHTVLLMHLSSEIGCQTIGTAAQTQLY